MRHGLVRLLSSALVFLALTGLPTSAAYAQGGTTSTLSGVVVDVQGGVVPGADVTAKHVATNVAQNQVTNSQGAFSFPGLNVGTYSVTVTLAGFKTVVVNNVVLTSGAPAAVRAVLEVGGLEEQIVVQSKSEVVQTQSPTVSTTINTNQIVKLPLNSRSAMDFVTFLPGVSTPGGNRQSTINGLPRGVINITLDGVNIQDNTLKTGDGFFAIVSPRLDAIEEVTVTTAAQGADGAGQGAVQIKFVTRGGSNTFTGSGYHYYRNDTLNSNTWFNNRNGVAKPKLLQNQQGFRVGGPIMLPGLLDGRNKAFFFVNYEDFRQPSDTTRNRTILNTLAQQGIYSYSGAGGVQTVNLLELAARNGQLSTTDPVITKLLADIRNSTAGGSLTDIDPNLQRFSFNVAVKSQRQYPTFRIDYNLTDEHRFTTAFNYQNFTDFPDTLNGRDKTFPGFPVEAGQSSKRLSFSNGFRSTLTSNLVNEARVAYSGAPVVFFGELKKEMWAGSVANQNGFQLNLGTIGTAGSQTLTNASAGPAPQGRNATSLLVEDAVTWLSGSHSVSFGASWTQYTLRANNSALLPSINFDVLSSDPANSLFTVANFPGASSAQLTGAQRLYNLLTGRVSRIAGDARLDESTGQYAFMGTGIQRARMREGGFYVQDAWRLRPSLTVNAGLRYELQLPFYPLNSSYSTATLADLCGISGVKDGGCRLFDPSASGGKRPEFVNFGKGVGGYNVDSNNFAPSVGFAWTPSAESGFLRRLLGQQSDSVIRAGFSRSFSRNGLNDFSGPFNANPGVVIQANREEGQGNLGTLPLLFRDTARLGPPAFAQTPSYPMMDVVTENINLFDQNIKVPYADSWTAGIQRSVGRNMGVEVRYVGTRSRDLWRTVNYNEVNIVENGFLDEFRRAQANLQANIAAGRPASFAYTGAPGTSPLPILLAHFNGSSQASNTAAYSGANWTNSTFLAFLAARNPNPFGLVGNVNSGLIGNATFRQNARNAGLPANFFLVNPDLLGGANLTQNVDRSNYHSLQLELRRRYAQGLQFQTSYVFGQAMESRFETLRRSIFMVRDTGSPGDLTHAFKANVIYELPFGRTRHFGSNVNGVVERIIGGWQLGVSAFVNSGQLVDLGNPRLVGMTRAEVQSIYKLRIDSSGKKVWMLPQDVIDNTIRAYSVSPTTATGYANNNVPTGRYFMPANGPDCIEIDNGADYGDCGARSLVVRGPMFKQTDLRVAKRTSIVGRVNFEIAVEMLNAFNNVNFAPVGGLGNALASYEVTGLLGTNAARVIQIVSRLNW